MATIDLLRELSHARVESRIVDIPFLLKAHEEGILDESALKPIVPLLAEELAQSLTPAVIADFFRELDLARRPPNMGLFAPVFVFPADLPRAKAQTVKALEELAARYPASADAYRPWLQELVAEVDGEQARRDPHKLEENFRFLEQIVRSEIAHQEVYEQQFRNRVYAAAIAQLDPRAQWLVSAHQFLNGIGGNNDPTSTAGSLEFDALKAQLPILSAALTAAFLQQGLPLLLLQIGVQTTARIEGEDATVVIDTPEFARLDVAMGAREQRPAGDRLVSLPVGSGELGHTRWIELAKSPLFREHPAKLLPSALPFGISFPKERPESEALEALVRRALPPLPQGQRLSVRRSGIDRDGSYTVLIASEAMRHRRYAETARLLLVIANGTIAAAEYIFPGLPSGHALSIVVDDERLAELLAQGARHAASPNSGAAPGGGGKEIARDEHPFTGVVDARRGDACCTSAMSDDAFPPEPFSTPDGAEAAAQGASIGAASAAGSPITR